jgi:hypothetical protein
MWQHLRARAQRQWHTVLEQANDGQPHSLQSVEMDTMPGTNQTLLSMSQLFEAGFELHLTHHGFSGMWLRDHNGNVRSEIPVYYDPVDMGWFMVYILVDNEQSALNVARDNYDLPTSHGHRRSRRTGRGAWSRCGPKTSSMPSPLKSPTMAPRELSDRSSRSVEIKLVGGTKVDESLVVGATNEWLRPPSELAVLATSPHPQPLPPRGSLTRCALRQGTAARCRGVWAALVAGVS